MFNRDYSGDQVTLVPGTLRGYRMWVAEGPVVALRSMTVRIHWWSGNPGPAYCCCGRCFSPPGAECSCGYYAVYNHGGYQHYRFGMEDFDWVEGSVRAHGRIVMGTKGFRAEKMEIEALWGLNAGEWAIRLNVPWFSTQEELVEAFPPSNVDELLSFSSVPGLLEK